VSQKRGVKDHGARQRLPDQFLDGEAALHCADRNVAERVIGEMQRHINKEHESGREAGLAKAGHCGSLCAIAAKSSSVRSGLGSLERREKMAVLSRIRIAVQ
jgi:hypothetical protein